MGDPPPAVIAAVLCRLAGVRRFAPRRRCSAVVRKLLYLHDFYSSARMNKGDRTVPDDESGLAFSTDAVQLRTSAGKGIEKAPPEAISSPDASATTTTGYIVKVFANWSDLEAFIEPWEDLAANALEPNPSYEWRMLIPAMRHQLPGSDVRVAMLFAADAPPLDKGALCGIFPLEVRKRHSGLPARVIRFWNHIYSVSATPLLRRDCAQACLRAFFEWSYLTQPAHTLVYITDIRADGKFLQVLTAAMNEGRLGHLFEDIWLRAMFKPRRDADKYIQSISTTHHRNEWRRQERRLAEHGLLTYDSLGPSDDVKPWLDEFVKLEMSGWKGREGTAFGCDERHLKWLTEVAAQAHNRGRLMILALRLDGKAIAMRINLVSPPGSYAFKIAFDENFSKFSPGVLLELQNIRRLHDIPAIEWMDSVAVSNHPLINRVWIDRVALVSILVSPGRLPGQLIVAMIPLLRAIRRLGKRSKSKRPRLATE